jgi:hypothetical protein
MTTRHSLAFEAAQAWLDADPTRQIVFARRTSPRPPGYEAELHAPEGVVYGDDLELVDALAEALQRFDASENTATPDTEPPPTTKRSRNAGRSEPLERDKAKTQGWAGEERQVVLDAGPFEHLADNREPETQS